MNIIGLIKITGSLYQAVKMLVCVCANAGLRLLQIWGAAHP